MAAPWCWRCAETGESERLNRAVCLGVWITGDVGLLCARHADFCKRGGGVTEPLPKGVEHGELSAAELREQLHAARVANAMSVPQLDLERALRNVAPQVLWETLGRIVAGIGGLSPPLPEIEEAPVRTHRRSQSASPIKKKRA